MVLMTGSFLLTTPKMGTAQAGGGEPLLEFRHLVGVSGVFLGPTTPLRNVPGGGAPWIIDEGQVRLKENGDLRVRVGGLVIVPTFGSIGGTNPVPQFFATLSCLDPGTGAVHNFDTPTFPATMAGDAESKVTLALPDTCVAPIVLIRGDLSSAGNPTNPPGPDPTDPWFAASGF